jgi:hypothetical protein
MASKNVLPSESNWHCRVESGISAPRVEQFGWVICPSGYFASSARTKNISLPRLVETALLIPLSRPTEGRIAIVTDAGWDAVDAAASGAQRDGRAGWRKARERSNGELTNDVAAYGEVVWS